MKITCRGWRRDSGPTTILQQEISDARPERLTGSSADVFYIGRTSNGVNLTVGPVALTLGGQYQVKVTLSDDDIRRLFLEIHPEVRDGFQQIFVEESPPVQTPASRIRLRQRLPTSG